MSPGERLADVQERIARAAIRAGRDPGEVKLLAVSKLQPLELVRDLYAAGQRDFGENYAQDLRDRATALVDLTDLRWHAIGPLQTNKIKHVARWASAFHALDRAEVAEELGRRRIDRPLDTFLEVNVGGEASKHGVRPDQVAALHARVREIPGIRVVGLMALPPPDQDPRPAFRSLRALAAELDLAELSIGTSADFEAAVEEGATWVRVGRTLFGDRAIE